MATEKDFLTVADLVKLSQEREATWRKRLAKGCLPYIKFGSNVRIRREDFERYVEAHTVRKDGRDLL